ncbi:hypothetical protein U9M48_014043 [Paspalum notatum var. saurae]|uniref:Uncharacterized protein n=1 Tax=Paspalum notatum var. saurae TaxID=547442 RepID=A0AAQ3WK54_PASNO
MDMELVLAPCAVVIMLGYHLLLLYWVLRRPHTTVIGYENHNKLAWAERVARATAAPEEAALALSVISDGISASTTLASLCIALASLIGAWVSSSSAFPALMPGAGEATTAAATAKHASLLACFLASFTCFVQSAGCYVRASFLITALGSDAPASHLQRAVLRGGGFWDAGLRALYLATALLVWVVFGPAAMLAVAVLTVAVLYLLDGNSVPLHRHRDIILAANVDGLPSWWSSRVIANVKGLLTDHTDLGEGALDIHGLQCGSFHEEGAFPLSEALGILHRYSPKVSQICLVANKHDDNVRIGVIPELLQPPLHILKGHMACHVVHDKCADSPSIVRTCNCPIPTKEGYGKIINFTENATGFDSNGNGKGNSNKCCLDSPHRSEQSTYLSWPAVSQIWALTTLSSTLMLLVANSTPMVDLDSRLNSLRVKRDSRLDLPTPESPMSTTLKR